MMLFDNRFAIWPFGNNENPGFSSMYSRKKGFVTTWCSSEMLLRCGWTAYIKRIFAFLPFFVLIRFQIHKRSFHLLNCSFLNVYPFTFLYQALNINTVPD